MTAGTRILLADDHALVRRGLRLILEGTGDFTVVAEASTGLEALALARGHDIDLVVMDIAMPQMTGLAAAREICRREKHPQVLMLSMYDSEQYFLEALKVGACGYVLKSAADEDLAAACRCAVRGDTFLYPGVANAIVKDCLDRLARGKELPKQVLTDRENQIVKLIAEGHSSKEIAKLLVISAKTVDRHRENILEKLGMRDRTELTRYAMRARLIEP